MLLKRTFVNIKRHIVSKSTYIKILEEIKKLKHILKTKVIVEISKARQHGDISENAEFSAAKEEQKLLEFRICKLEKIILSSKINNSNIKNKKIIKYGAVINLLNIKYGTKIIYKIVSNYESNISCGLISISSPIAEALIKKREKQILRFKAFKTVNYYKIVAVKYN